CGREAVVRRRMESSTFDQALPSRTKELLDWRRDGPRCWRFYGRVMCRAAARRQLDQLPLSRENRRADASAAIRLRVPLWTRSSTAVGMGRHEPWRDTQHAMSEDAHRVGKALKPEAAWND